MKWMRRRGAVATATALIESPLRAETRSEKINHSGSPMTSRQRRARVRAALSTSFARSQSGIATRKRPGAFTNKRLWHAMLVAFMCFSGPANAKTWYYFQWHTPHSELPLFESMDAFCKAYKFPEQSYFVPDYSPTTCEYYFTRDPSNEDYIGTMHASIVDCADPNSKPIVPAWGKPSCKCSSGYKADPSASSLQCIPATPPEPERSSCAAPDGLYSGNPIFLAGAEKVRAETDWEDSGPAALGMVRFYRSNWGSSAKPGTPTGLGRAWSHNHAVQLQLGVTSQTVAIIGPEGHQRTFSKALSSAVWIADNSADSLSATPAGWIYKRADDDTQHIFDSSGRLQTRTGRGGFVTTYGYDGLGRLVTVSNGFGRTLSLGYDGAGRLSTVTTPDGRTIGYAYDAMGRLAFATYPDGKSRGYLYENGSHPHALTGIVDESGVR
jgi:YD repeat-containing protein